MKCIYCNCTESRVVDSRPTEDGAIRRRRECEECKRRFTTYEKIEMLPVLVVKKDRRREPFDAAKVRNGILRACEKRPVPLEEIEKLVRRVETSVFSHPWGIIAYKSHRAQRNAQAVPNRLFHAQSSVSRFSMTRRLSVYSCGFFWLSSRS